MFTFHPSAAVDVLKMAQDLVPCQRLPDCGSGYRQAVPIVAPGFSFLGAKLAIQKSAAKT
jgi:hypothetical protein